MLLSLSNRKKRLISGYIIGSPTSERAQWRGFIPSSKRSGKTPGTPIEVKYISWYFQGLMSLFSVHFHRFIHGDFEFFEPLTSELIDHFGMLFKCT